jgi:hypothetical protein
MRITAGSAILLMLLLTAGCGLEERIPAEMVTLDQARPIAGEASLNASVSFDIGALEINAETAPGLYSLNMEYDKAIYNPDVSYGAGRLGIRLESTHKIGIHGQRQNNRLRLNLSDALPISLEVNTGVGDARLALSRLRITRLDLQAGVGSTRISSYDPNPAVCDEIRLHSGVGSMDAVGLGNLNFRRMEFEGGVGGAKLDFSGGWKQDAEIRLQLGLGGVSVRMPREVGVRVRAEKHFLSGLQLDGFTRESGGDYYSERYNEKKVRVTIVVQNGIGGFSISWL